MAGRVNGHGTVLCCARQVLIGMHGAAWINGMFLRPGGCAVQLLPYGWDVGPTGAWVAAVYKHIVTDVPRVGLLAPSPCSQCSSLLKQVSRSRASSALTVVPLLLFLCRRHAWPCSA